MTTKGLLAPLLLLLLNLSFYSCKRINATKDDARPHPLLTDYFDKKYLLYKLPPNYYENQNTEHSFTPGGSNTLNAFNFKPLGHDINDKLQYTHVYSRQCVYHTSDSVWKYAEVCFPNTCLTKDDAYAQVTVTNSSAVSKKYFARLFYQNTTYWYRTDDSIDLVTEPYLDNYYGASEVVPVEVPAGKQITVKIPYSIGMNPKGAFNFDPSKDPARPGNYEFIALVLPDSADILMHGDIPLQKINPFAVIKKDQLLNKGNRYIHNMAYVGPEHFKFVFLDEYFDGKNDIEPNHVYVVKNGKEKSLCDTCSGWYRAIINEHWKSDDFFKGYISKQYFVKADYGIKASNCRIDTDGITIKIPASKRGEYKKTWGEFLFGPSFKYGHLTVRAKFAQMMNKNGTPNGIIHNLWLYQRDPDPVDTTNPYSYLRNDAGKQPYEIDFEIWNSQENINTMWDDNAFINYSIVDYMRNPKVTIKPGEIKEYGKYHANRLNNRQLNVPGENIPKEFFNSFHTYELYWYPDKIRFLVDGTEHALITKDMAAIPDKYLFLWIGSPLYQDGTYYQQSSVPFLQKDKYTIIDYIRIE
jgi:hypothetical protein